MALDDLLISTGVDQLIRIIKEKGKVEISVAANELHQPIRIVEDWARVLEEEGLIKIEYRLTKIYLIWKEQERESLGKKRDRLEEKAEKTIGEIRDLLSKVEEGGKELQEMQSQLAKLQNLQTIGPQEANELKAELDELSEKYKEAVNSGAKRMEKLRSKLDAIKQKMDQLRSSEPSSKDSLVLQSFQNTIKAQIDEANSFFDSFEERLKSIRNEIEEKKVEAQIEEIRGEISQLRSQKDELIGAIEAILEEQKNINQKILQAEKKLEAASRQESLSSTKKKLSEIRQMEEEAKKQRKKIMGELEDALSLVKKHEAKLVQDALRQKEIATALQQMKDDYVDISEEISRANEELASRQKSIVAKIESHKKALEEVAKSPVAIGEEEMEKIHFMFNELSREQALLENRLHGLMKEAEILKMQAGSIAVSTKGGGEVQAQEPEPPTSLIEKINISKEDELEFEKKRDELRSLIRKMWEESKGGSKA